MAINLDAVRRRAARVAQDDVVITREPKRYDPGTMDPVTLAITHSTPETVYDGKAFVTVDGRQARTDAVGGNEASQQTYLASLPLTGPEPDVRPGDLLQLVSSKDAGLQGRSFKIRSVDGNSAAALRTISMVDLRTSRG